MRRIPVVLTVLAALAGAPSAHAALGDLTQLPGTLGCTKNLGPGTFGCAVGTSLDFPYGLAVSADGENAYVAGFFSDAIAVFDRDPTSGSMLQKANPNGCISPDGSPTAGDTPQNTCRTGNGTVWNANYDVVVSPDGKHVYGTWTFGILAFSRNVDTGDLTQLTGTMGCISETTRDGKCTVGNGLQGQPVEIVVSADGQNVYTATSQKEVATFTRDETTGQLTYESCFNHDGTGGCTAAKGMDSELGTIEMSPDDKAVYVGAYTKGVVIFDRDPLNEGALSQSAVAGEGCIAESVAGCATARHLTGVLDIAFSPEGDDVYVAAGEFTIVVLERNATTNELSQPAGEAGCVTHDTVFDDCAIARNFMEPSSIVVSPDGMNLYVGTADFSGIAVFDRDPATGALTQKAGHEACISGDSFWWTSPDRPCKEGRALRYAWDIEMSPDGSRIFLAANHEDALSTMGRDTEGADPDPDPDPDPDGDGDGDGDGGGGDGPPPTQLPIDQLVAPPIESLPPRPVPAPRPSRVRTVHISARPGNGTVDVEVGTDGAGRIEVTASAPVNTRFFSGTRARRAAVRTLRIARVRKTVTKAGKFKLTLRPTARAKKVLRRKGKLKARLVIRFTPVNGTPASTRRQSATFKLRRRR
jgi:DNA-binding beta-propeller fold protein YncE